MSYTAPWVKCEYRARRVGMRPSHYRLSCCAAASAPGAAHANVDYRGARSTRKCYLTTGADGSPWIIRVLATRGCPCYCMSLIHWPAATLVRRAVYQRDLRHRVACGGLQLEGGRYRCCREAGSWQRRSPGCVWGSGRCFRWCWWIGYEASACRMHPLPRAAAGRCGGGGRPAGACAQALHAPGKLRA